MTIAIPVFVAIVGGIVYVVTDGKGSELGRLAFAAGMIAALFASGSIHLGGG